MRSYKFRETVRNYIKQNDLIRPGETVLAAVSGGADSVCLLLLLKELSGQFPFSLSVIHVEHGIRGEESRADACFAETLCRQLAVSCRVCPADVPDYAARQGLGIEEAARQLRYAAFAEEAKRIGAEKVALAHHRGDRAETLVFHLCRGTGLSGLAGMSPCRPLEGTDAQIIRPLLGTDREEIRNFLREAGQQWREDSSNTDTAYMRNRIRLHVMPELNRVNDAAEAHIAQTAEDLALAGAYLRDEAEAVGRPGTVFADDGVCLQAACFAAMHPALRGIYVQRLLEETAGSSRDLTRAHILAVCGLFSGQVGRRVSLPYGLAAERTYDGVRICRPAGGSAMPASADRTVISVGDLQDGREQTVELPGGGRVYLKMKCLEPNDQNMKKIPQNKCTKWFDCDKIIFNLQKNQDLQIRHRLPGDYFQISAQGGHRRLKDWMIDEKIPAAERDGLFLLAADSHVLWVFGRRTSEAFYVDAQTRRLLVVRYE